MTFSADEIRRAWVGLIDIHISIGPPSFDFLWNAITSDAWGDGRTRDPALWSDWIDALVTVRGYRWDPPIPPAELWGAHRLRVGDGHVVTVMLEHGRNSDWSQDSPIGPENGLTEEEGLDAFDILLENQFDAGITDLLQVRDAILAMVEGGDGRRRP
jgi:hypothetical protein